LKTEKQAIESAMTTATPRKLDRSKTDRAKGTPNKTTALLKNAILKAAKKAG